MKICLIGNNLTSLLLASMLSKKKLFSHIYSHKSTKSKFKTRTLGISHNNIKYLNNLLPKIEKNFNLINEIKVIIKNKKSNDKIIFNQNLSALFHMVKYDDLFNYITKKTLKNKFVSFKNIKTESKLLSLKKDKKYSIIINCEKSNILSQKFLRKGIFKNYNNTAFTTIIKHSKIKNNKATQVFTKDGPIAYLPLSDILTSVVFSFKLKNNEFISESYIIKKIKEFNPLYKIISYEKVENFKLTLKLAKKYYYNNILFFGDSIHSIHPLVGQGFNITIRDIKELSKIIDEKINLGLQIDKKVFQEFENKTKSLNSIFSLGIDFIYEFFNINKKFIPTSVSEKIFSFVEKNDDIKNLGIKFADKGLRL